MDATPHPSCWSRRAFLLSAGTSVTTVLLTGPMALAAAKKGRAPALRVVGYPAVKVGRVSQLKVDTPVFFQYPGKDFNSTNALVRLGVPAGGGVGPDRDIVAFNNLCTHMGGPLQGTYKAAHKVLGPCPFHLTTFDLTRHGIVVAGQATESLPQVVLDVRGDDLYATGMMGLIYGYANNLAAVR